MLLSSKKDNILGYLNSIYMALTQDKELISSFSSENQIVPKTKKIIAFLSQKGGVGKTTTAVHAREWFSQFGSVGFVDADAQQSSSRWLNTINQNIPVEVTNDPATIYKELPLLKKKYDFIIVDAPGSLEEVSRAILSRCDLVAIPSQPSHLDLDSNVKTIEMVDIAQDIRSGNPQAVLFLNLAKEGTVLLREAKETIDMGLANLDLVRLQSVIHRRQCITDAPGQHTTIFSLAKEIKSKRKGKRRKKNSLSPEEIAEQEYKNLFTEIVELINA